MKFLRLTAMAIIGLTAFGNLWAGAGPSATASSATVSTGPGTADITVTLNDTAGAPDAAAATFVITYDAANLSVTGCTGGTICDFATAGQVSYALAGASAIADGTLLATITFDTGTAAAAVYPIAFAPNLPTAAGPQYTDAASFVDAPLPTTDGAITVSAGPGPGVLNVQPPTAMLMAEVNGAAATSTITISNDGVAGDSSITPSCSLGATTGTGTITVSGAVGTLAPGASGTVTANCSGTAVGTAMATYTCTAGGAAITNDNTVITCDVATGVPAAAPVPGSTTAISVGPVIRGGTGSGALTFRETNASGGSFDVACTAPTNAAFAIVGASSAAGVTSTMPFTLTVSGTSSLTDPQPTDTITCTYSNGVTGAVTVNLGIQLVPEIIPTLSQWGLILLILAMVGFGVFQVRRTSA